MNHEDLNEMLCGNLPEHIKDLIRSVLEGEIMYEDEIERAWKLPCKEGVE